MKVGETVPVTIAGQVVAQATIKEKADGSVTLLVPGTLVVMATRTELAVETPVEQAKETIITGVDRASGEPSSATVGEQIATNETGTTENVDAPQVQEVSNAGETVGEGAQASPATSESEAGTNSAAGTDGE